MNASPAPALYTLPRRERDPMGVIFPSIGIVIWVGAASCWFATEQVARAFGYQAALGRPLIGHIYSPFEVVVWTIRFDHPASFGTAVHRVFVHAYAIDGVRQRFRVRRRWVDGSTPDQPTPTPY